jgi:hypothetical protein
MYYLALTQDIALKSIKLKYSKFSSQKSLIITLKLFCSIKGTHITLSVYERLIMLFYKLEALRNFIWISIFQVG